MRIPSAALALLLLAPASCKKYDKDRDDPGPDPAPARETTATAPPPKTMPPKKKALKPEELGSCTLKASGAVEKEQTTFGGRDATNITYWMTEEEKRNLMGTDGFVIHCRGPDIKLSLVPSGKKDSMPFKPKKYTFTKGTGDANVNVLFGNLTLDAITGHVDVTAFDARHIAGTIELQGKLVPGGKAVKLTGSFDLRCPGFGACETEPG